MGSVRLAQRRRQRRDGAARGPAGGPPARGAGWSRTARIAGIVAVGAIVVTWLNIVPETRQLAGDRPPMPRLPAVDEEVVPVGLAEGAARLRERLRAAPRPFDSDRNPFRLPVAAERAVPLPTASDGPRSAPRAGARSAVNLGLTLIGIATTETADGPRRTAVLLRRGEVVLAEPGQPLGGGWTLADVEDDSASFRNAAGDLQRRTLH